jgi:molybdate transport system ATP-binding protein
MEALSLKLDNLEVTLGGKKIIDGLSWEIRKKEQWAVWGSSGAGKTVLAETLAGKHFYRGTLSGPWEDISIFQQKVLVVEQQHRFKNLSNQSDFYYQQRYNAYDASRTMTVAEDLQGYPNASSSGFQADELIDLFQIRQLLSEPLIQLSNGENKRLQIVKALLTDHTLLILDQPFTGLDAEGRRLLADLLNRLSAMGEWLMLITSPRDVPACFTHIAELKNGRILRQGGVADFSGSVAPGAKRPLPETFPSRISFYYPDFEYAVRLVNVNVRYEEKSILQSIDWEVKKGSCWSLSGPNGAGKSTLLSLITGDNPKAYANEIYLFDRRRGTGESIWEIKQKTGFLSPELHLYFDPTSTVYSTVASGLWDTIGLFRTLSPEQHELTLEWLDFLGLSAQANHLLRNLPSGLQRVALLGRAMIKTPPLLVLDEPFQGLDPEYLLRVKTLIDQYCGNYRATLIFVSHYVDEIPAAVNRFLRLEKGCIV